MRVTLKDIAGRAGVSIKTASNVINGRAGHFSPETFDRVMGTAAELGYTPNLAARQLRTGRTGLIALVLPDIVNPYFSELARRVILEAEQYGYTVLLDITLGDAEQEQRIVRGERIVAVDGLLVDAVSAAEKIDPAFVRTPMVLLGERVWDAPYDHVVIDNRAAAQAATEHLIRLGRTRIAPLGVVAGAQGGMPGLRLEGFLAAMQAAGLPVQDAYLTPGPPTVLDWHHGEAVTARLLQRADPPDALFCFSDVLAFGAMKAIRAAGRCIPEDVAVIGIDDVWESAYWNPPLSTIAPDKDQLVSMALALLMGRIKGLRSGAPKTVYPAFRLMTRASTIGEPR